MAVNAECLICMEEKHDFVFLKCSICSNDICFSCLERIQSEKCPFFRGDYKVQKPHGAWTHFLEFFDRQDWSQVAHLFSSRHVPRIFIPREWAHLTILRQQQDLVKTEVIPRRWLSDSFTFGTHDLGKLDDILDGNNLIGVLLTPLHVNQTHHVKRIQFYWLGFLTC